jgi:hypothetical protein
LKTGWQPPADFQKSSVNKAFKRVCCIHSLSSKEFGKLKKAVGFKRLETCYLNVILKREFLK